MKSENYSDLTIKNLSVFENDFLGEIMKWATEKIFQKIWMDEKWDKCAKGGDARVSFEQHRDMMYQAHIFSGLALAMKVIDYKFYKKPCGKDEIEDVTRKLKRGILGYVFHDYNKLDGSPPSMRNKDFIEQNAELYFGDLMKEYELTVDDIYQVAYSTEIGTTHNINRNEVSVSKLYWESSFSRLSDHLSSVFNRENGENWKYKEDIDFKGEGIIPGSLIERVSFSSTGFIALTQIVRKAVFEIIKKSGNFYLWSSLNSIYYVKENPIDLSSENISERVLEILKRIVKAENGIKFTDRRVDNSSSVLVSIDRESLIRFVMDPTKFRNCLHLDDLKLNVDNRIFAEKYTDLVANLTQSFSFKFRTTNDKPISGLRQGLVIREYDGDKDESERLHAFLIRYVQLNSKLKGKPIEELREKLKNALKEYKSNFLQGLLGKKDQEKSTLLIPFLLKNESVEWDTIENLVLKDMNKNHQDIDLRDIISRILKGRINELPEVPDKHDMSMVNGFPANRKAISENLFGIGTNSFNNRLPTSGIANGKIDQNSIYEFALRKNFMPNGKNGGEALVFIHFPGAIPFINLAELLKELGIGNYKDLNFRELEIAIDAYEETPVLRLDNEFFFIIDEIRKDEDLLKYLYDIIQLARSTKMMVKLAFSNAPVFEDQLEMIVLEIQGSATTGMYYDKIRCNRISEVLLELKAFNSLVKGEILGKGKLKNTAQVIRDYIQNPFSIFSYIHSLISSKDFEGRKVNGLMNRLSPFLRKLREMGYETTKDGGKKMENIKNLANAAYELVHLKYWDSSSNERTWMLRDTLESLEKAKAVVARGENRSLIDFEDIVNGVIFKTLSRDKEKNNWEPQPEKIKKFSELLFKLLKEDFNDKIPSGQMRSYLINAFEFEYILISKNRMSEKKGSDKNE